MGSASKKAHEPFEVTPSDAPIGGGAIDALAATAPVGLLADEVAAVSSAPDFTALVGATGAAYDVLAEVAEDGLHPQLVVDLQQQLNQATSTWLKSLSDEELQALAEAKGFQHPELVGLSGNSIHPLVHWLDPAQDDELPSKLKIQLKALERYNQLVAGETIDGKTLADFGLPYPASDSVPFSSWHATPIEVAEAHMELTEAWATWGKAPWSDNEKGLAWLTVLAAENRLATAECPEAPELVAKAKALAKSQGDNVGPYGVPEAALISAVDDAVTAGRLPSGSAEVLSTGEVIRLLRASTAVEERQALLDKAAERGKVIDELTNKSVTALGFHGAMTNGNVASLASEDGKQALFNFAGDVSALQELQASVAPWHYGTFSTSKLGEAHPIVGSVACKTAPAYWVTQDFRQWAKTQKLSDLRAVATKLGMETAGAASRADVQNWIAGQWDSGAKAKVAEKLAAKATLVTPAAVPTGTAPKTVKPSTPIISSPHSMGSFSSKHLALVNALKHHAASTSALPERLPQHEVDAWTFDNGPSKGLGGAHSKSLHTAPDGSTWMFKPDNSAHGARAEAEAAASRIYQRVGLPAVPVYTKHLGQKTGSIQPLLSGVSNVSENPSSWSQADVDAMVRLHVAAWAVGDHDGKSDNVLRTASGGLVPCDHGQAFKFFGQDKLSLSYHPNKSYGAAPAVFHQAYTAAKQKTLSESVHIRPEAALPVIKAFEALPDGEYRSMLQATAHEGVKRNVHWVTPMRQEAAKRLGKTTVTNAEVAAEFIDHAIARKAGLRQAFSSFFEGTGVAGAHKIAKVQ